MNVVTRIVIIGVSLLVLVFVVNLVRTRKLKEEMAILWLLTAVILVLLPIFVDVVDAISYAIGIDYPPAMLFVIAFLGVTFILFQFSVAISRYSDQIKVLTQELAILRDRVREMEERAQPPAPGHDAAKAPREV